MKKSITDFPLRDFRGKGGQSVKSPTVHIARGYDQHLPILTLSGRPIVCISDWQCETSTQRYFWTQAWRILQQQVGSKLLERPLVIVAGDMASKDNALRGAHSDDVPDFSWLQENFPEGDIVIVYGNHDYMSPEHLQMINPISGVPCLLPHGSSVGVPADGTRHNLVSRAEIDSILENRQPTSGPIHPPRETQTASIPGFLQFMTKEERAAYYAKQSFKKAAKPSQNTPAMKALQWDRGHPEQTHLTACFRQVQSLVAANGAKLEAEEAPSSIIRVGAVHGIPAAHNQGLQKVERKEYFQELDRVCDPSTSLDVLVTHCNPVLPGPQEAYVRGDDARHIYNAFRQSQACLHVCGHMHLDPPIAIVANGKVLANADCRVIVFVPSLPENLS